MKKSCKLEYKNLFNIFFGLKILQNFYIMKLNFILFKKWMDSSWTWKCMCCTWWTRRVLVWYQHLNIPAWSWHWSICPFLQFVIIWDATECMEKWRGNNSKLVSFDSKSMPEITSYLVCYSWEPLRMKLGYLFPSKFISKRPYIVLVKPKPKYHGSGVRGLRFDYMVVTSTRLFWEWRFEIE
jgi:hypothetical protein